ncbi:MAG: hypothetical protein KJ899_07420 [Gammaproteobacteria bacterium]|nr:hypothetical protein [Gammaproteobacteria bacterium]
MGRINIENDSPSLMKLLAIQLSPQAGKSLVIRRRPESSAFIQNAVGFALLRRISYLAGFPPSRE